MVVNDSGAAAAYADGSSKENLAVSLNLDAVPLEPDTDVKMKQEPEKVDRLGTLLNSLENLPWPVEPA